MGWCSDAADARKGCVREAFVPVVRPVLRRRTPSDLGRWLPEVSATALHQGDAPLLGGQPDGVVAAWRRAGRGRRTVPACAGPQAATRSRRGHGPWRSRRRGWISPVPPCPAPPARRRAGRASTASGRGNRRPAGCAPPGGRAPGRRPRRGTIPRGRDPTPGSRRSRSGRRAPAARRRPPAGPAGRRGAGASPPCRPARRRGYRGPRTPGPWRWRPRLRRRRRRSGRAARARARRRRRRARRGGCRC